MGCFIKIAILAGIQAHLMDSFPSFVPMPNIQNLSQPILAENRSASVNDETAQKLESNIALSENISDSLHPRKTRETRRIKNPHTAIYNGKSNPITSFLVSSYNHAKKSALELSKNRLISAKNLYKSCMKDAFELLFKEEDPKILDKHIFNDSYTSILKKAIVKYHSLEGFNAKLLQSFNSAKDRHPPIDLAIKWDQTKCLNILGDFESEVWMLLSERIEEDVKKYTLKAADSVLKFSNFLGKILSNIALEKYNGKFLIYKIEDYNTEQACEEEVEKYKKLIQNSTFFCLEEFTSQYLNYASTRFGGSIYMKQKKPICTML